MSDKKPGTSLYHIEGVYRELYDHLEAIDGVLTPELEAQLAINQEQLQEKVINYGYLVKYEVARIEEFKKEEERLKKLRLAMEKRVDDFKQRMACGMNLYGIEKVKSENGCITVTLTHTKAVEVKEEDIDLIPDEFKTKKTVISVSKNDLKPALEAEEEQMRIYAEMKAEGREAEAEEHLKHVERIPGARLEHRVSVKLS